MRTTAAAPASLPVLYRELQADAVLAEELGFHSLWLSEHHFWYDGWCPSLLVAGASVLGATHALHLGTGVLLLPLHDPHRLAAAGLALEEIAPGRCDLGVGLGYREPELDGLDELTGAWADGGPSLWIGGIAERSLSRAATRGLSLFLPSSMRLDQLRDVIERARAAASDAGMPIGRIGVRKNAWVTDGSDAAAQRFRDQTAANIREYAGSWWMLKGSLGFDVPDLLDRQMERAAETVVVGPPEHVAESLAELAGIGVDLVVLHVSADYTRPAYREAMHTLAADVLPLLQ
jgi:alkanesulfonate monooxygenase SsuD/methylene tetrahydromethanopterin reductase-like flavin-dependent oxidoreductase (luciferase family)